MVPDLGVANVKRQACMLKVADLQRWVGIHVELQ